MIITRWLEIYKKEVFEQSNFNNVILITISKMVKILNKNTLEI